jgi:ribonuclease-3 family protein
VFSLVWGHILETSAITSPDRLQQFSAQALAHIGDGVYELMVRVKLCAGGTHTAGALHRASVALVRSSAQAKAARAVRPLLTPDEERVFLRGRNAKLRVPKDADPGEYGLATGLECLFGHLYLSGERERVRELFEAGMEG